MQQQRVTGDGPEVAAVVAVLVRHDHVGAEHLAGELQAAPVVVAEMQEPLRSAVVGDEQPEEGSIEDDGADRPPDGDADGCQGLLLHDL